MVQYEFEEQRSYGLSGEHSAVGAHLSSQFRENWELPLVASKLDTGLAGFSYDSFRADGHRNQQRRPRRLQAEEEDLELRARRTTRKVILINLIALFVNLLLAIIGFYLSFTESSTASSAFAADCLLDLLSSAILLWRYYGDLSSLYMEAREQIACIYLGALFEISSIGIIIKSLSDITSSPANDEPAPNAEPSASYALIYLAITATVACSLLAVIKCHLYKVLRDKSILLDVINTIISTVFALSIIMSQALIDINPAFWYLDPILSIVLAIFMMGFGIKVIHQNFNVLKPASSARTSASPTNFHERSHYLQDTSLLLRAKDGDDNRWRTNYSTINFQ